MPIQPAPAAAPAPVAAPASAPVAAPASAPVAAPVAPEPSQPIEALAAAAAPTAQAEPAVATTAQTEPPVVESAVVEPAVVEPAVVEPALATPAVAEAPAAPLDEAPAAAAVAEAPMVRDAGSAGVTAPPFPLESAAPSESRLPAPASAVPLDLLALPEPPRWLVLARQYPVLWMVVAPVVLALLFISVLWIASPPPRAEAPVSHRTNEGAAAAPTPAPADAPAAPNAEPEAQPAVDITALEAKPSSALSAGEVLQLNEGRALQKRQAARALGAQLRAQPDLAGDAATQKELLRLAADPATANEALAAIAHARAPIGADLLFEIANSKSVSSETSRLAAELLGSVDVRPTASPALAVALDLRAVEACEAAGSLLPRAEAEGDRRSLPGLAKLSSRRGCGAKKAQDCYPCLRGRTKELLAAQKATKSRAAPTYAAP